SANSGATSTLSCAFSTTLWSGMPVPTTVGGASGEIASVNCAATVPPRPSSAVTVTVYGESAASPAPGVPEITRSTSVSVGGSPAAESTNGSPSGSWNDADRSSVKGRATAAVCGSMPGGTTTGG